MLNIDEVAKGKINHVAMVTGTANGEIYYAAHSDDREGDSLRTILTKHNYRGDLYFIHVRYE